MDNTSNTGTGQSGMNADSPTLGDSLHKVFSNFHQQYAQNDTANIPHDDIAAAYNQWSNQAPPHQQQAAIEHAFSQASTTDRSNIAGTLLNLFMQNGLNPQAAGVQTTNPAQMNPQDLAKMTTYAQQQNPDIIRQLLSNPLVGMAISAALSYALQRFLGGTQGYNQPVPQQQQGGGGLGGLLGQFLGGGSATQSTPMPQTQAPQQGGGLGDLFGQLLGGGSTPAPQTQAPQQGGGLGDLFGQLLGGGNQSSTPDQSGSNQGYTQPSGDNPLDVTKRR